MCAISLTTAVLRCMPPRSLHAFRKTRDGWGCSEEKGKAEASSEYRWLLLWLVVIQLVRGTRCVDNIGEVEGLAPHRPVPRKEIDEVGGLEVCYFGKHRMPPGKLLHLCSRERTAHQSGRNLASSIVRELDLLAKHESGHTHRSVPKLLKSLCTQVVVIGLLQNLDDARDDLAAHQIIDFALYGPDDSPSRRAESETLRTLRRHNHLQGTHHQTPRTSPSTPERHQRPATCVRRMAHEPTTRQFTDPSQTAQT